MAKTKTITPPLRDEDVADLRIGDAVHITGTLYTARDAAHKRLVELIDAGDPLPVDLKGQIIYYAGPTPAKPGRIIGSVGPTTSGRMDPYTPKVIEKGLKGMIGKGIRGSTVVDAMKKWKAVYLAATGGAAALIAKSIVDVHIVAYEDLGAEAIRKLEVKNFPAIVVQDMYGGNLYKEGVQRYQKSNN
jgi:fumarate hydratase subunit beta